jgi:hypothetical protein
MSTNRKRNPLRYVNWVLQIFCVRLTLHSAEFKGLPYFAYSLMYWVVPFTGWRNDYKFIGSKTPKYFFLTDWL